MPRYNAVALLGCVDPQRASVYLAEQFSEYHPAVATSPVPGSGQPPLPSLVQVTMTVSATSLSTAALVAAEALRLSSLGDPVSLEVMLTAEFDRRVALPPGGASAG